jgi:hypothetical protein
VKGQQQLCNGLQQQQQQQHLLGCLHSGHSTVTCKGGGQQELVLQLLYLVPGEHVGGPNKP